MTARILFVEDDIGVRDILLMTAREDGHEAEWVMTAEEALERLGSKQFDIVVSDVNLPGMSGLDLLPHVGRQFPDVVTIVITAYGTIDVAVEAMKRGAVDFLTKPFDPDDLLGAIQVAARRIPSRAPAAPTGAEASGIVTRSAAMQKLLAQVAAVAPFNTTVLITGETGVGKELIARYIHNESGRKKGPLVALNCAAVPEQLLEDELFGHVKGAFTGAHTAREGRFEQANGGTLFLDEIGDMSLPMQAKLLRVLQEREFERLGSSRTIAVDVRVVAATSANLEQRVADGSFRADLYYRLNVMHMRIPPLRERPEDVPLIAEHLLARFCKSTGLPPKTISEDAWPALVSYRWPGNVRQLQNAVERAAALTGAAPAVTLEDFPEEVRGGASSGVTPALAGVNIPVAGQSLPEEGVNFDAVVTNIERDLLLQSLQRTGGNKMRAAKLLNMKRTTFIERLKRHHITTGDDA
jgi:DNA-binding NtrC family response regulator